MSLQKKNVIQEFVKEDYVPTADQILVKYVSGKGNNLHEVECVDGSTILVSMPKKYRHTVWLKKDDCLVIDPIEEGKKVKGEIMCVLPNDTVRDLISDRQWPSGDTDGNEAAMDTEALLRFFATRTDRKPERDDLDAFPPSESEEEEEEEDDDDDENDGEEEESEADGECEDGSENDANHEVNGSGTSGDVDEAIRDRNRSRVQLVTSGVVTVTNVITEGLDNDDIQSLEFEADEESADELSTNSRELERHANTIRIQVNYNNANTCSGASGD